MSETSNSHEPVETTESTAASVEETSQETTETPESQETTETTDAASAANAAPAAPQYQPNYKYKAFGKEKELPETFRSLLKDADTEKSVKEVFTRADAFDDMKGRYENTSKEFQTLLNTHQSLDRDVRRVMNFRNNGDYDNFFAALKISDNDIFRYVEQKLAAMKDPAQLAQYNQAAQQRAELMRQQDESTMLRENYNSQAVQHRNVQLDMVLSRPDVSTFATAWDSKSGTIGAFRNLVIQEALNHWYATGQKQDLSAEQAVDMVLKKFGKFVESSPQAMAPAATPGAPGGAASPPTVVVAPKPTMPNITGKGASPVQKVPKSLDELRKLGREKTKAVQEIPNF